MISILNCTIQNVFPTEMDFNFYTGLGVSLNYVEETDDFEKVENFENFRKNPWISNFENSFNAQNLYGASKITLH